VCCHAGDAVSETRAVNQRELRKALKKYGLPLTGPLFDNAYSYVRENY
jgi:hypothetical protein